MGSARTRSRSAKDAADTKLEDKIEGGYGQINLSIAVFILS